MNVEKEIEAFYKLSSEQIIIPMEIYEYYTALQRKWSYYLNIEDVLRSFVELQNYSLSITCAT